MDRFIREIAITEIDGVSIGHAQDNEAKTGASVLYFKRGAQAGCDISGGGPASRETRYRQRRQIMPLNAVVLSGGSCIWSGGFGRCDALSGGAGDWIRHGIFQNTSCMSVLHF